MGKRASEELLTVIAQKDFPCIGAKSAMARGTLKTLVCQSLLGEAADAWLHSWLLAWVRDYQPDPSGLRSLTVVFSTPTI